MQVRKIIRHVPVDRYFVRLRVVTSVLVIRYFRTLLAHSFALLRVYRRFGPFRIRIDSAVYDAIKYIALRVGRVA